MLSFYTLTTLFGIAANAIPFPNPEPPTPGEGPPCPVEYNSGTPMQIDGTPHTGAVYCTSDNIGCTIGTSETYSVSTTVTVGLDLGLDLEDISLGLSTSIAHTWGTANADTGSVPCPPGPFSCGLLITPSMLTVDGTKAINENFICSDATEGSAGPYTVQFPAVNAENNAIIRAAACTCPEQPGADTPGAPALCPGPCNTGGNGPAPAPPGSVPSATSTVAPPPPASSTVAPPPPASSTIAPPPPASSTLVPVPTSSSTLAPVPTSVPVPAPQPSSNSTYVLTNRASKNVLATRAMEVQKRSRTVDVLKKLFKLG